MYAGFKVAIKDGIRAQFGTIKEFIDEHPSKEYTQPKLSKLLNPSRNCNVSALIEICELINYDIVVKPRKKRA